MLPDTTYMEKDMVIRTFEINDEVQVIELWKSIFPISSPHHDPLKSIERKLKVDRDLFLVAVDNGKIVGTVMGGYDGHRGWIYSVAVHWEYRKRGIGSVLLKQIEAELLKRDCPKVNIQILETNAGVVSFYKKNGYDIEPRISMGKRLD